MVELETPFTENALWHIAELIASRYKSDISNIAFTDRKSISQFFRRAGFNIDPIFVGIDEIFTKLERIQESDPTTGVNNLLRIIEQLCSPEEFIGEADQHKIITEKINDLLLHYRLRVENNGKLRTLSQFDEIYYRDRQSKKEAKTTDANLFDTRKLHPEVIQHGRLHFIEGRYFHAIFECCKAFDRYVSKKANSNESGTKLMQRVLAPDTGSLRLNALQTQTEKDMQLGLMQLCLGLMFFARNPGGHEPELAYPISREDTLDLLSLISLLYRQIEKAVYISTL